MRTLSLCIFFMFIDEMLQSGQYWYFLLSSLLTATFSNVQRPLRCQLSAWLSSVCLIYACKTAGWHLCF